MATEEPHYQLLIEDGAYTQRLYGPRILAETDVEGTLDQASSAGFRRLAGYIFGKNRSRTRAGAERIAMTAPVLAEARSEKIAMTAPVLAGGADGHWQIRFVMPAGSALNTLPVPIDPAVRLRELAPQRVAAIRFSGLAGEAKVSEKTALLQAWTKSRHLTAAGAPQLARYNPPWTLPFLRRNEILIDCR